jgi:hypothetical protein
LGSGFIREQVFVVCELGWLADCALRQHIGHGKEQDCARELVDVGGDLKMQGMVLFFFPSCFPFSALLRSLGSDSHPPVHMGENETQIQKSIDR